MSSNNPVERGLEDKWFHDENQKVIKAYQEYLKHKAAILDHVKNNSAATADAIAKALNIDVKIVDRALKELAAEGVVSKS